MTPAQPSPAPPILLVAFNHQLFGLDPATGAIRWELECFAIRTGALLWKQAFKGKGYGGVSLGVPGAVAHVDLAP